MRASLDRCMYEKRAGDMDDDQSRLTPPRSLRTNSVGLSDALALSAGGDFFASCRGESASIQALESLGMTGSDWIRLPPAAPSLHAITGTSRMAAMAAVAGSAPPSPLYAGNAPPSESPSYVVKTCDSPIPNFILDPSGSRPIRAAELRDRERDRTLRHHSLASAGSISADTAGGSAARACLGGDEEDPVGVSMAATCFSACTTAPHRLIFPRVARYGMPGRRLCLRMLRVYRDERCRRQHRCRRRLLHAV
jgi:hypothetical protein